MRALRSPIRRPGRTIAFALVVVLIAAAHATAQTVSGTVHDASTGRELEGVRVVLIDGDDSPRARTLTRHDGDFSLTAPHAGWWRVAIEHLGYAPIQSTPFEVREREWVVLQVTLAVEAISLDPIVVTARRASVNVDIQRFYERRDRSRRSGSGYFLGRDEIEAFSHQRPTDILRSAPGVRVVRGPAGRGQGVRMAGNCVPAIYIDGMRINRMGIHESLDDYVAAHDIEGVEVYRGPSSQQGPYNDPAGCGLVLVWTRSGVHEHAPSTRWKTVLGTLLALALIVVAVN